jgi:hypothetical protein
VGAVFDEGSDFLMLILLMLVGLWAWVCMHLYDGAAVATDCKQTNKHMRQYYLIMCCLDDAYIRINARTRHDTFII